MLAINSYQYLHFQRYLIIVDFKNILIISTVNKFSKIIINLNYQSEY